MENEAKLEQDITSLSLQVEDVNALPMHDCPVQCLALDFPEGQLELLYWRFNDDSDEYTKHSLCFHGISAFMASQLGWDDMQQQGKEADIYSLSATEGANHSMDIELVLNLGAGRKSVTIRFLCEAIFSI